MGKSIADYKKDYADAARRNDSAGMSAANEGANAIRRAQGQTEERATQHIGQVSSGNRGSSSGGNSYAGSTSHPQQTTYRGPNGGNQTGYWINGKTYKDPSGSQRIEDGSIVKTDGGYYRMVGGQGVKTDYGSGNWIGNGSGWSGGNESGGGGAYQQGGGQLDYSSLFGQMLGQQQNYYGQLMREQQRQYAEIQAQQEAAKRAAVDQAVGQLNGQKTTLNQNYQDLYRQLYLDRRNAEKDLPQQLAAMGVSGGMTESSALGIKTSYAEALRQGEQAKQNTLSGIEQAITDARFSGDISIADQAAQNAKDQLASYASTLGAMQGQDNWNRQFSYQGLMDMIGQNNYQQEFGYQQFLNDRNFNYQAGRDQTADNQWQQQFDWGKYLDMENLSRQQLMDEVSRSDTDYSRKLAAAQYLYENAGDASGLSILGYTPGQISALHNSFVTQQQTRRSSGNGGNSNSGTNMSVSVAKDYAKQGIFNDEVLAVLHKNGYNDEYLNKQYGYDPSGGNGGNGGGNEDNGPAPSNEWAGIDRASVLALGYGSLSRGQLEDLVENRQVITVEDPASGLIRFVKGREPFEKLSIRR